MCSVNPHVSFGALSNSLTAFVCLSGLHVCRNLKLDKVGVTNGVLRGLSGLESLQELLLPNSHRMTDVGLGFFSSLTNLRCALPLSGYIIINLSSI